MRPTSAKTPKQRLLALLKLAVSIFLLYLLLQSMDTAVVVGVQYLLLPTGGGDCVLPLSSTQRTPPGCYDGLIGLSRLQLPSPSA